MTTALNSKHMTAIQNDGEGRKLLIDVLGETGSKVFASGSAVCIKNEYPLIAELDKHVESLEQPFEIYICLL